MNPIRVGLLNFESLILNSKLPVLLVFGAIWDRKSSTLFYVLDQIAEKYDGHIITGKVDYDYVPDIFTDCGIKVLPTMIFFEDGKEIMRHEGMYGSNDIEEFIRRFYGVSPNW